MTLHQYDELTRGETLGLRREIGELENADVKERIEIVKVLLKAIVGRPGA